jgi:cation diffusion facilitator family transporter
MMLVEIVVGYATSSMSLLVDGWHMATHVGAFGIAAFAYALSRRLDNHAGLSFGTAKIETLAGFSSAIGLGLVAIVMTIESSQRLVHPVTIDFRGSLPVAVLGLFVNLASIWLLHREKDHDHDDHQHDHNHRAAVAHVIADALTSVLAICALLAGRLLGTMWLDPVTGIVGGLMIVRWAFDLSRHAALELIDVDPSGELHRQVREALEQVDDVRITDLHVWSLGGGARGCVVTLTTSSPREPLVYRSLVTEKCKIAHVTIEVNRCHHESSGGGPERVCA